MVQGPRLGEVFRVRMPTVAVTIFGILGLLVLGLTAAHIWLSAYQSSIVFFSLAVTAAASLGSAFYLGKSIRLQLDKKREDTAFEFMVRWNDPQMFHTRKACYRVLEAFRDKGPEAVKECLKDEEIALGLRHVLNFFEEISLAIAANRAEPDLLAKAFGGLVIRCNNALDEWIKEHRRLTGREQVWAEFKKLYDKWQKT